MRLFVSLLLAILTCAIGAEEMGAGNVDEVNRQNELQAGADAKMMAAELVEVARQAPPLMRQAWLAEIAGLVFTSDGGYAYEYNPDARALWLKQDVTRYMSADGQEHSYHESCNGAGWTSWKKARADIFVPGVRSIVCKAFEQELNAMRMATDKRVGLEKLKSWAVQDAVSALRKLSQRRRDAWLAERLGLLYKKDGGAWRVWNGRRWSTLKEVYFVDSEGNERDFFGTLQGINWIPWVKAELIEGQCPGVWEEILATFSKEVQAMQKEAKKPKNKRRKKEDEVCSQDEIILQHEINAITDAEEIAADVIDELREMPALMRQVWLAELSGLVFTDDGGYAYEYKPDVKELWVKKGVSCFMGADGQMHRCNVASNGVNLSVWKRIRAAFFVPGVKEHVYAAFEKELRAMREATNKRVGCKKLLAWAVQDAVAELQSLTPERRDAWLAERLGLLYKKDGGAWRVWKGRNWATLDGVYFVDSEGNEQLFFKLLKGIDWIPWVKPDVIKNQCPGVWEGILKVYFKEVRAMQNAAEKRRAQQAPSAK